MSEGAGSYLGFGYELARGVPGPITSYMPFQSETINPKFQLRPNPNINPRRSNSKGRMMRVEINGNVKGAPDSESQTRLRASHQGKVVSTVPVAGVAQHVLTPLYPGDADPAVYRKTLSGVIYRDDGVPEGVQGGVVNKVTVTIREGEYVDMVHDLMFANLSTAANPATPAAANNVAFTGSMFVRGLRRDPSSVLPVYVIVTTTGALDGSAPIPLVKVKIGGAIPTDAGFLAEFLGPAIPITHLAWTDTYDAVLTPVGPGLNNPFQIMFRTAVPADVLTVGDAWTIPATIAIVSSPPFTSREVYDYGQLSATIDGKVYVWKSAVIEGTKVKTDDRGLGSYFSQQYLDNGEWQWKVTFERNYSDRTFVNLIRAGGVSQARLLLQGARIAATAYRDSHEFLINGAQYDEAGTNVANAGTEQERVALVAYDDHVNPICQETIVNTLAVGTV